MSAEAARKAFSTEPGVGVRQVRRRRVFYVAGFDPASPQRYHRFYRENAARQAEVTGAGIDVGPAVERGPVDLAWTIDARWDGDQVKTDYEILCWHDLVRRRWPKEGPGFFLGVFASLIAYWRRGILAMGLKHAPLAFVVAITPAVTVTLFALVYAGLGAAAWVEASATARAFGWPPWSGLAGPALALATVPLGWRLLQKVLPIGWLARGMAAMAGAKHGCPDFQERLDEFAQRLIVADRAGGCEEILVVGHSMGCQHAAAAVGRAVRLDPGFGRREARLNLLTLGQLIPFYTLASDEPAHRADLLVLAGAGHIGWLDIAARWDPGSVGTAHPLTGIVAEPSRERPRRRSPAFHQVLTPENYRKARWRLLEFHAQYLFATDYPGGYDFFRLTAGPDFLTPPAV
jgi:hypothetical protein